jgi:hypothetical protein
VTVPVVALTRQFYYVREKKYFNVVAIVVPRLHDSAEDAVLTYGLSYFLDVICPTGQQWGILLLMSILDVVSCDVARA